MKNYFTIILLVLLCGCVNSNEKATTRNIAENIQKKYRNYDFDITINVEHSEIDFKYLINVSDEFDDNHNLIFYEDNLLQYTTYKYKKTKNLETITMTECQLRLPNICLTELNLTQFTD